MPRRSAILVHTGRPVGLGFNEAAASNAAEMFSGATFVRRRHACFNEAAASNAAEMLMVRQHVCR